MKSTAEIDSKKAQKKASKKESKKAGRASGRSGKKGTGAEKKTVDTKLEMTGRELVTINNTKAHPLLWFLAATVQLMMLAGGLCGFVVTGLSLSVNAAMLAMGMLLLCLVISAFFYLEQLNGYRLYISMGGIVVYAVVIFLTQNQFTNGAMQLGNALLRTMNRRYESNLSLMAAGGDRGNLTLFLLEISVIVIIWMASACVYRPDVVSMSILLFPIMALTLLGGGEPSIISLFLLLFGLLSVMAAGRSVRKKRMWGEKKTKRFMDNLTSHKNIQKKTAFYICGAGLCLSIAGFYIVKPVLSLQLEKAETVTAKVEGQLMEALIDILPAISAGQLNLRVETPGGGVSDGALGDVDGYALQSVEDLKVTVSEKPTETIYLKGYVGSGYTGDHWLEMDESMLEDAAINWKTEGNPKLYIQNLPFLRALYVDNQNGTSGMQEMSVVRINANSSYTYYPYYSFLNDFYEVQAGDGYVAGQDVQDDIFSYYPRSVYQQTILSWNENEDNKSVLDRVEALYASFAKTHYLEVPEGFEELQAECDEQDIEEGDVDAVRDYIRLYFAENYTFSMEVPALPEGEDFVKYFLYETKTGYSTHYASAATIMFRMFGIPARYVVGYAAPQNLFTSQPDGTYTAVLQGDNSHAWAEIYIEGEGWTPVESTPGGIGTSQDVEFVGEKVTNDGTPEEELEEEEEDSTKKEKEKEEPVWKDWFKDNLESVIHIFAVVLLGSLLLTILIRFFTKRSRVLGLNRKKAPEVRIRQIFQACYGLLEKRGLSSSVESGSKEFEAFVREACPDLTAEEYERMIDLVYESCYSFVKRKEKDVAFMRRMYRKFRKSRTLKKKSR